VAALRPAGLGGHHPVPPRRRRRRARRVCAKRTHRLSARRGVVPCLRAGRCTDRAEHQRRDPRASRARLVGTPAAPPGPAAPQRRARGGALTGAAFALPAFLLMLATLLVPLGVLAWLSLTDYELGAVAFRRVGLDNFARALADPVFQRSLRNTFLY